MTVVFEDFLASAADALFGNLRYGAREL